MFSPLVLAKRRQKNVIQAGTLDDIFLLTSFRLTALVTRAV